MADPAWVTYGGLVSGVIGSVGSVLAWWRAGQVKALDLRVELAKAEVEIAAIINELPALLTLARRSRERVAAATGQRGALQGWLEQWETDSQLAQSFSAWLPPANPNRSHLSQAELESRLISAVKLQTQAKLLREKYEAALASDDKERDHIRADVRSNTHAKLQAGQ